MQVCAIEEQAALQTAQVQECESDVFECGRSVFGEPEEVSGAMGGAQAGVGGISARPRLGDSAGRLGVEAQVNARRLIVDGGFVREVDHRAHGA